jgi:hypothetical protein
MRQRDAQTTDFFPFAKAIIVIKPRFSRSWTAGDNLTILVRTPFEARAITASSEGTRTAPRDLGLPGCLPLQVCRA